MEAAGATATGRAPAAARRRIRLPLRRRAVGIVAADARAPGSLGRVSPRLLWRSRPQPSVGGRRRSATRLAATVTVAIATSPTCRRSSPTTGSWSPRSPRAARCGVVAWDREEVDWGSFAAVVIRSTWDYARRAMHSSPGRRGSAIASTTLPRSSHGTATSVTSRTREAGVAVVDTRFVGSGRRPAPIDGEVVVKPTISAGGRDTGRVRPRGRRGRARRWSSGSSTAAGSRWCSRFSKASTRPGRPRCLRRRRGQPRAAQARGAAPGRGRADPRRRAGRRRSHVRPRARAPRQRRGGRARARRRRGRRGPPPVRLNPAVRPRRHAPSRRRRPRAARARGGRTGPLPRTRPTAPSTGSRRRSSPGRVDPSTASAMRAAGAG